MRVYELMRTDFLTVAPEDTLANCRDRFAECGSTSAVVAVDLDRVLGVVTHEDLYWGLLQAPPIGAADGPDLVADVMTSPAIHVGEDDDVVHACSILSRLDIAIVPVIQEDRLIGVVEARDVVAAVAQWQLQDPLWGWLERRDRVPTRPRRFQVEPSETDRYPS